MEKIIQITINSTLFSIEEIAYTKLSIYLEEIKEIFQIEEGGQEIIKDIEARIAEHLKAGGGQVVTILLVEAVIAKMGIASDLCDKEIPTQSEGKKSDIKRKRLFRDEDHAIIGGVCSGIAAYIDVDPTWVRISFIIIAVLGFGIIIPIYIILWLITPPATTITEKLEMHGTSVDLNSIVGAVRTRINEHRDQHKCCDKGNISRNEVDKKCTNDCKENTEILKSRATKIVTKIIDLFGLVFRILVGSIVALCGFSLLLGFAVVFSTLLSSNIPQMYDAFISANRLDPYIVILVVSSITAFLIPSILIFYGGIAMATNKTTKKKTYGFLTLAVWMLAVTAIVFSLTRIGINFIGNNKINAQTETERYPEQKLRESEIQKLKQSIQAEIIVK